MLDVRQNKVRPYALEGNFGLEREALRVTGEGRMAHTPHPFPDSPRIVRDFCENQTEINTGVHPDAAAAVAELAALNAEILRTLAGREYLWPFSNPPFIADAADVMPAKFDGEQSSKGAYRDYLAAKYGRYLMTFCGIHVNFSFGERLVAAAADGDGRAFRDRLYLHVAEQMVLWGWIVVPLTAASPLLDASYLHKGRKGGEDFLGLASVRCSEFGYWNQFAPINDFSSVEAYAHAIRDSVRRGYIAAPSELYFPIRLKPRGANSLSTLVESGVDHIEVRCVDLNPLVGGLADWRDIFFIQLLLLWCAARPAARLTAKHQLQAVQNFKNAARYDIDLPNIVLPDGTAESVRRSGIGLLAEMRRFFADFPPAVLETLDFERNKLEHPECRPAVQVRERFGGTFAAKGLDWARQLTEAALHV